MIGDIIGLTLLYLMVGTMFSIVINLLVLDTVGFANFCSVAIFWPLFLGKLLIKGIISLRKAGRVFPATAHLLRRL